MNDVTPVLATWLRIQAKRIEREVGQTYHRVLVADPYMRHPETEPALNRLAQGSTNAGAIASNLTAYLEAHMKPETITLTLPAGQPLIGLFAALRDRGLQVIYTGARSYEARERPDSVTAHTPETPKK